MVQTLELQYLAYNPKLRWIIVVFKIDIPQKSKHCRRLRRSEQEKGGKYRKVKVRRKCWGKEFNTFQCFLTITLSSTFSSHLYLHVLSAFFLFVGWDGLKCLHFWGISILKTTISQIMWFSEIRKFTTKFMDISISTTFAPVFQSAWNFSRILMSVVRLDMPIFGNLKQFFWKLLLINDFERWKKLFCACFPRLR